MNRNEDPMGHAIADYLRCGTAEKLRVLSPLFEEDEIPLKTLFRKEIEMPHIERIALSMATGRILDVGAGAGCHSLALQKSGADVTAIDISPLAVEAMRKRGVRNVLEQDFFSLDGEYDTILMLMNGIGIAGSLERLPAFFRHLDKMLAPGGQLICDSSDIRYLFEDENGGIDYPGNGYYGEQVFHMQYKDIIGNSFPWLYIDKASLTKEARKNGFDTEIVADGCHCDYLARISRIQEHHQGDVAE